MTSWLPLVGDARYMVSAGGQIQGPRALLRLQANHAGYLRARLGYHGRTIRVHREVAKAFLPNPEGLAEVNHKDGDKQNNAVSNLEWCSRKENMGHAFSVGLCTSRRGETSPRAILSGHQVAEIRAMYVRGSREFGTTGLGARFGVSPSCIHLILTRKNWGG